MYLSHLLQVISKLVLIISFNSGSVTAQAAFLTFVVALSSSAYSGTIEQIEERFTYADGHPCHINVCFLGLSTFVLHFPLDRYLMPPHL
jgi:hypothetical protein